MAELQAIVAEGVYASDESQLMRERRAAAPVSTQDSQDADAFTPASHASKAQFSALFVENELAAGEMPYGRESAIVLKNDATRTLTVRAHIVCYGELAAQYGQQAAADIQIEWNSARAKVLIDGAEYKVLFRITYQVGVVLILRSVHASTTSASMARTG